MGRTGIIGAMEEEVALLKEKMEIEVVVKKASMEFYQGHLNGREVVVVRSGIGKVNAGMCAQILVDAFNVSHLINTGIAGSLKAEINIGDIVVSSDALQHDMDARQFGYARGEIPRMDTISFPADPELIAMAKASLRGSEPGYPCLRGTGCHGRSVHCGAFREERDCVLDGRLLHRDGRRSHCAGGVFEQGTLRHRPRHFR